MSGIQSIQNNTLHQLPQGAKKAPSLSFEAFLKDKFPELASANKGVKAPPSDSQHTMNYYNYRTRKIADMFKGNYDLPTDKQTSAFMEQFGLDKQDVQYSDGDFYVKFLNGTGGYGYLISEDLNVLQKDLLYFKGLGGNASWDPQHKLDLDVAKKALPKIENTATLTNPVVNKNLTPKETPVVRTKTNASNINENINKDIDNKVETNTENTKLNQNTTENIKEKEIAPVLNISNTIKKSEPIKRNKPINRTASIESQTDKIKKESKSFQPVTLNDFRGSLLNKYSTQFNLEEWLLKSQQVLL